MCGLMSESDASASRPPLRTVFRHRNYRLFFSGQLLSLMGSWMQTIGQAWLVYRLTGSPLTLGIIGFFQHGPLFLLAPFGGTIADRVDRRTLIILTQTGFLLQAVVLAVLSFTGVAQVWHVAALAFCYGLLNAVDIPARQSFTVEMVGRDDMQSAIALNSILFNIARVAGPAIAGIVIAAIGESWCFALNAVSYLAVLCSLALMTVTTSTKPPVNSKTLQDLADGFRYVTRHRAIRTALLALALSSFAGGPYLTMMPVFAREVLGGDADTYGLLMTGVGMGALGGAFVMGRLRGRMLSLAPTLAAMGFGICLVAFSQTDRLPLAFVMVLPTAFFLMLQGSSTNIAIQLQVDDRMRGRVMAYYTMSFLGMMPFGALFTGWLADQIGVANALTFGGAVCSLVALTFLVLKRR